MSYRIFFIFFLFFAGLFSDAFAQKKRQQEQTDSLLTLLRKAKEDTNKILILNRLVALNRSNLIDVKKYTDAMMDLAQRLKVPRHEYNAYGNYFTYYRNNNNYDRCIEMAKKRLEIAKSLQDANLEAGAYNDFGIIYGSGLHIYDRSIAYFKRSLNLRLKTNNKNRIETIYNNIADSYNQLNQHLDSALYYVDNAIALVINDPARKNQLSTFYSTKGEIYASLKEWNKATSYLKKAQGINEEVQDFTNHTYVYNYLGKIYEQRNMLDSAEYMYRASLDIFEEKKIKNEMLGTYEGLANVLAKRKKPEEALKYYRLKMEGQDANLRETLNKMRVIESQHEAEEREKDKKIRDAQQRLYTWIFVGIAFIVVVMAFFLVQIYRKNQIEHKISLELAKTNEEVERKSAEMQMLNGELNSTVRELSETIEMVDQQKQLTELANQRMHDSIKYGKKIQEAILPTEQELHNFQDNFVIYMPRDTVSGDFYWYYKLNESTQYIAALDCTGHGVPGAFMSMIGYSLLNQIISETQVTATAEILRYLDLGIVQGLRQTNNHNADGMDVCLCKIERQPNGKFGVEFAGAKRPLYYAESEIIQLMRPTRESIGGITAGSDKVFQSQRIELHKDDVLYLTTDGFTDNPNKNRKRFGEERFAKLLQAVVSHDMKTQKEYLLSAYQTHQEGTAQRDDITVLGIRL